VAITQSAERDLGQRRLQVNLAPHAATDGDVWVYDPATKVVAAGDLVTLPVPFLDTACVGGWRAALDAVWATPFTTLVPGHGAPMSRDQFAAYRTAFDAYADCVKSSAEATTCASGWAEATKALQGPGETRSKDMAAEYADYLRQHGGNSERCLAP